MVQCLEDALRSVGTSSSIHSFTVHSSKSGDVQVGMPSRDRFRHCVERGRVWISGSRGGCKVDSNSNGRGRLEGRRKEKKSSSKSSVFPNLALAANGSWLNVWFRVSATHFC